MLKQAARDREAASEERQVLLEAIQSGAGGSAGRHHLALQVCHQLLLGTMIYTKP